MSSATVGPPSDPSTGRRRRRRRVVGVIGVILGVTLVTAAWIAIEPIGVGVGHKAKTMCSGVFVSGREPAAVLTELQVDDLAILRHISASVDVTGQSVTASALGLVSRRAVHRRGLGCTLVLDWLVPPKASRPNRCGAIQASAKRAGGARTVTIDGPAASNPVARK